MTMMPPSAFCIIRTIDMRRFLPDTFTILLVCTVILASLLPISGEPADWFGLATKIAIGLLFFLHGARLSRDVVVAGLLHWRLHLVDPGLDLRALPAARPCRRLPA